MISLFVQGIIFLNFYKWNIEYFTFNPVQHFIFAMSRVIRDLKKFIFHFGKYCSCKLP